MRGLLLISLSALANEVAAELLKALFRIPIFSDLILFIFITLLSLLHVISITILLGTANLIRISFLLHDNCVTNFICKSKPISC